MIAEAQTIEDGSTLKRDVCVIGAGAAGLSVALELVGSGLSVCVLESGGFEFEEQTQDLYRGTTSSELLAEYPDYLTSGRLRFLGGSTNHWAGFCAPLDPIDFEERSWVPESGWPLRRRDLDPYYVRAETRLEVPLVSNPPPDLPRRPLELGHDSGIETHHYFMSPPTRFGARYRDTIARADDILLLLHANAVELVSNEDANRVDGIEVATLRGHRFSVRARQVVIAAGAIENARLLLNSNRVNPKGLGNDHDLVGRYFTDHFYVTGVAETHFVDARKSLDLYRRIARDDPRSPPYLGVMALSEELQREHRLLNHQLRIWPYYGSKPLDGLSQAVGEVANAIALDSGLPTSGGKPEQHKAYIGIGSELAPDPNNRVRLTDEVDALGMRRLELRCGLGDTETRSLERTLRIFARMLGKSLRARVNLRRTTTQRWSEMKPGFHQIGTTRAHVDPRRGVVDSDCRVHGIANLFVAGSSVFPTAGRVNPTLTLVALAIRLAERIERNAKKEGGG